MNWRALEQSALKRIRVWWRPATCVGIAGGVIINAVVLPLMKREPMDLSGFAAVIASCATIFAVREWGKIKGVE
jgi:hypothetical protein